MQNNLTLLLKTKPKKMEKKFKYPVCYKVTAENQAKIVDNLLKMGYKWTSEYKDDYIKYPYLLTFYSNELGLGFYSVNNRCELITDLDLFYALATMVDDDKFYEGETVVFEVEKAKKLGLTSKTWCKDMILQIKEVTGKGALHFDSKYPHGKGNSAACFRKATKEEIIEYFRQKRNREYISREVDDFLINDKPKTMKNKEFTVGGNKHLKQALINELLEVGLTTFNGQKNCSTWSQYLHFYAGMICAKLEKYKIHYELPMQYNEAKQAFLDAFQPKEIKTTFKGKEIILTEKGFKYGQYERSVSFVEGLAKNMGSLIYQGEIQITPKITIGCNKEFENVRYYDLQDLLELHAIKFPKQQTK